MISHKSQKYITPAPLEVFVFIMLQIVQLQNEEGDFGSEGCLVDDGADRAVHEVSTSALVHGTVGAGHHWSVVHLGLVVGAKEGIMLGDGGLGVDDLLLADGVTVGVWWHVGHLAVVLHHRLTHHCGGHGDVDGGGVVNMRGHVAGLAAGGQQNKTGHDDGPKKESCLETVVLGWTSFFWLMVYPWACGGT